MKVRVKFIDAIKAITGTSISENYIELEAEPVEERPEWGKKFDQYLLKEIGCAKGDLDTRVYNELLDFIRTEVITKLCDEINSYYGSDNKIGTTDAIIHVKNRWLA